MNSTPRRQKCFVPLALTWSHAGTVYRVTPWPEVRFECRYGDDWIPVTPSEDVLASAASALTELDWRPYFEFFTADVREFLAQFTCGRMEALQVIARCPSLLHSLVATPALTAFVAAHASLRGTDEPGWDELAAVHERGGIFGVLEWLGLPASRQTLGIFRNIAEPDLPKRFLQPLRTLLWEPTTIFALQRMPAITDRQLAHYCHALAA